MPATITVTSLADAGAGTFRAAITQADADTTPDTIAFAPAVTGTIRLVSTLPDLTAAITIAGPGASVLTVARSGASGTPAFRVFSLSATAESRSRGSPSAGATFRRFRAKSSVVASAISER